MRIARLVEEPDWRDILPQIDKIFFATSAVQTFRDDQHRVSFKGRWLGRYLEHFTKSFFIARDEDGTIAGYLAGCLDNPVFSPLFNTVVYRAFAPLCAAYPCHLHVNVDARFRNRRVGTALIEAFAAHARNYRAPGLHVVTDRGQHRSYSWAGNWKLSRAMRSARADRAKSLSIATARLRSGRAVPTLLTLRPTLANSSYAETNQPRPDL